jgi:hypothetical protein
MHLIPRGKYGFHFAGIHETQTHSINFVDISFTQYYPKGGKDMENRRKILFTQFITVYVSLHQFPQIFKISENFLVQQMHYLLKHKILQFVFKCLNIHFSAPTCFGPLGTYSGSIRQNLAKVTKITVF